MRTGLNKLIAIGAITCTLPSGAWATDIPFDGAVTPTCTMVIQRDGQLRATNGGTQLRSNTSGGNARVNVFTNSSDFGLSVDSPAGFDLEPAADIASPEAFETTMRGRRDTRFGWTTGPAALNQGETRLRVRMIVRKSGGDVFAAGDYRAFATLRCE